MPDPDIPRWEDELTADQLDRFLSLRDNPSDLLASLREDMEFQVALARADTRPYLVHWFSEMDISRAPQAWAHDPERTGPIGPNAVGTEWSWVGVHDDKRSAGAFNGTAPTNREVRVRGFTLMGVEDGRFKVRRYVDWAGLFAQLHLSLNWRTPTTPVPSPDEPDPD